MLNRNAKRWIKALRSGKYKQTQKHLRDADLDTDEPGYCCLGVACDLYAQTHKRGAWDEYGSFVIGDIEEDSELPDRVAKWLGIKSTLGYNSVTGLSLIHLNDDDGLTFAEIADHIEQYQDVLFESK